MRTKLKLEFGTEPSPRRSSHCTPEQARELLEGLRAAYRSLLPAERIVIRDIVAHATRTQLAQEMNTRAKAGGVC